MEQELFNYVEQELKRGVTQETIKKALRSAGWDDATINETFNVIQAKLAPPTPGSEIFPKKNVVEGENTKEEKNFDVDSKKISKPMVIAISVFGAVVLVVLGLIFYFNLLTPKQVPEIEFEQNQVEPPPSAETVVENPVVGDETNPQLSLVTPPVGPTATTTEETQKITLDTAQRRDEQRMLDMEKLAEAQNAWIKIAGKYYTCGLASGDCNGKPFGYPTQIGNVLTATPQDPLTKQYVSQKAVCGKDYVYCGLNNAPYPQFFCYYAKLEGGGYYTASHSGNFKRSTPPKIFEQCAVAN